MEFNRSVFLFLLLFLFFFKPAGNPPRLTTPNERHLISSYISLQRNDTLLLQKSTFGNVPGNITGISMKNGHFVPTSVQSLAHNILFSESLDNSNHNKHVFYSNYSGIYTGKWSKLKNGQDVSPRKMEIPSIFDLNPSDEDNIFSNNPRMPSKNVLFSEQVKENITEEDGKFSLSIDEIIPRDRKTPNVTIMKMEIAIQDVEESVQYNLYLTGLHIRPTGNVILSTSSLKYSGLQYLPHLIMDETYFEESKSLMVRYLNTTLAIFKEDSDYLLFEDEMIAAQSCEFIFYGHFQSSNISKHDLNDIEDEIRNPVGRPHKPIPQMRFSSLIYSPDCAFVLDSENAKGEKYEIYWKRIRTMIGASVALLVVQAYLMANQMKDTNTPSYLCKVSFYTIAMMSIVDGSIWVASFASSFIEGLALPFMAIAFLSFALTSMFEMRYLAKIYQSQLTERQADARVRATFSGNNAVPTFVVRPDGSFESPSPTPQPNAQNNQSLPTSLPTTEIQSEIREEDLSERAIGSKIYSWFYFALLGFVICSLVAATWPISYRRKYEFTVIMCLYSIWVPQIERNIARGFRRSFLWSFIIGTSIVRLIPVLYFTLNKHNILRHHYDPFLAICVSSWLVFQVLILYTQNVFGPRFFLPRGYLPVLYDYHPILTQGDIETGISDIPSAAKDASAPLLSSSLPVKPLTNSHDHISKPTVDCAICMTPVELVITSKNSSPALVSSPALILARRKYMVTPCRHVFHTECMEQWMRTRLQCPICRNPLPPV